MKKRNIFKKGMCLGLAAAVALSMAACSKNNAAESEETTESVAEFVGNTTVVPAGTEVDKIDPDTVLLTIGDVEVPAYEMFYYYNAAKLYYEQAGYVTDWAEAYSEEMSLADFLKYLTEEQALELNYYCINAEKYNVELSEEDKAKAAESAAQYIASLDKEVADQYGLTEENVTVIAQKYAMANQVYEAMVEESSGNLTDEEKAACQFRKIQHILITTMEGPKADAQDSESESETMDSEALEQAQADYEAEQYKLAEEVLAKARSGEDFEELASQYTSDGGVTYSINDAGQTLDGATMVTEFTEGAVALKDGEISDIVQTQYGYHIIKCVTTNDEESTATSIKQLASSKMGEVYSAWHETEKYEFAQAWKDMAVINPAASENTETSSETDEETEADQNESVADTKAEAE